MIGFNLLIIFIYGMVSKGEEFNNKHFMDIGTYVKINKSIDGIILENFDNFQEFSQPPALLGYTANFESNKKELLFCNTPVTKCWLLAKGSKFMFFILVKNNFPIQKRIEEEFGTPYARTQIDILNKQTFPPNFLWKDNGIKISLSKYFNIFSYPNFFDCYFIVLSNMTLKEMDKLRN